MPQRTSSTGAERPARATGRTQPGGSHSAQALGQTCILVLEAHSAWGLIKRRWFARPDPYVEVVREGEIIQSNPAKRTTDPRWNELLTVHDVVEGSWITVRVLDKRRSQLGESKHYFLGEMSFRVQFGRPYMLSKELGTTHEFGNIVVAGSICLAITFCSDNDDFPTDALPPQPTRALPNPRSSLFGNRLLARERRSSLPAPARVVETFGMGMGRESGWEESEMAAARLASLEESRPPQKSSASSSQGAFSQKLIHFRAQPELRTANGECSISVRRSHLFEDSYDQIMDQRPAKLKRRLSISFKDEEGLDAGGLSREFFFLLSKEIFRPDYGFFEFSAHDDYTLQINPDSGIINDLGRSHLDLFKFCGRVVGLCIFHSHFLEAHFVPAFYKMILQRSITLADMESTDVEMFRSLSRLLRDDFNVEDLDSSFSYDDERFGKPITIDLVPGGRDIPLRNSNKREYVTLVARYRIYERVKEQLGAFREGFNDLILQDLTATFDERELELLVCGIDTIDMDDWQLNTEYTNYVPSDPVVRWFWNVVRSWPMEKQARLLQFVTGTSRIPSTGFKDHHGSGRAQKFMLERIEGTTNLPRAHTCFNRLDLPPYPSSAILESKLSFAIDNSSSFSIQ